MLVEQFVMAYAIEQDRIRALLPEGYESLRPVLRINTEIRDERSVYVEFNTPAAHEGKRGSNSVQTGPGDVYHEI